jgi:mRNA interferase HicA
MKKRDLIKRLRAIAKAANTDLELVREGANHEVWTIGDERLVIPRHREINEYTAEGIIKKAEEVTTDGDE